MLPNMAIFLGYLCWSGRANAAGAARGGRETEVRRGSPAAKLFECALEPAENTRQIGGSRTRQLAAGARPAARRPRADRTARPDRLVGLVNSPREQDERHEPIRVRARTGREYPAERGEPYAPAGGRCTTRGASASGRQDGAPCPHCRIGSPSPREG